MAMISLSKEWQIGDVLGEGGFGSVYAATDGQIEAAAKFIPKEPGAERELLIAGVGDARNVVPVLDSGETEDSYVIVMPRAECSLADTLKTSDLNREELVIAVLGDVLECLVDLEGEVVHRDIKPENILCLDGKWCLADFGISRYAEASTSPDTKKFALSSRYASPEQWRLERARAASDIYSLGVVAYEIAAGRLPFPGPSREDYREQHLHDNPQLDVLAPPQLASLVGECLKKPSGARPGAAGLLDRLDQLSPQPSSFGLGALRSANVLVVAQQARAESEAAERATSVELRQQLLETATQTLDEIVAEIVDTIMSQASAATLYREGNKTLVCLGEAKMAFSGPRTVIFENLKDKLAFDIVAVADIRLQYPRRDQNDYGGRSHSLWYCDARPGGEGEYSWFETAFMTMFSEDPRRRLGAVSFGKPFALDPGEEAALALSRVKSNFTVAWPFTPVSPGFLDDIIIRWAGWLADASHGA